MTERRRAAPPSAGALAAALAVAAWIAVAGPTGAVEPKIPDSGIKPGPTTISEEEKAIAPDPNKGAEHAVILLEEGERDETSYRNILVSYHRRAKILSNEGRVLADIELPFLLGDGDLKQWWGRVLLPEGGVLELKKEDLKEQTIARGRGEEVQVLKAALPGVVAGSVIDWGFVFNDTTRGLARWRRIDLQEPWPILESHYKWTPWERLASAFIVTRGQGLGVTGTRSLVTVNVTGRNLPPVVREPWMPPIDSVQASVSLFYFNRNENHRDFWNSEAKRVANRVQLFLGDKKVVQEALAAATVPAGADLPARLAAAYGWLGEKIQIASSERGDGGLSEILWDQDGGEQRRFAREILAAGKGTAAQMDMLFIGLARALGAEAELVLATDRTDHVWENGVVSLAQFDESVVAVRNRATPEAAPTIVDPGCGLPYGEIPWWISGSRGVVVSAKGAQVLDLQPPKPEGSLAETKVEARFEGEGQPPLVRWTRTGTGQYRLTANRLRRLPAEERGKEIEERCGASADYDVSRAEAPKIDEPGSGYSIECEGTLPDKAPAVGAAEHAFEIGGPWILDLPELTARTRVHPLVFRYPRREVTTMEVSSPPGFEPKGAPAPIEIDNPFGSYSLRVTVTPAGYKVERSFTMILQKAPPNLYAGYKRFLDMVRNGDRTRLEFKRAGSASR